MIRAIRHSTIVMAAVAMAIVRSDSGTVTVAAGSIPAVLVAPGATLAVPVIIDMSAATAGMNVASLTTEVTWPANRLVFDSVKVGPFGSLTSNTSSAASGSVLLTTFSATGTTATVTAATLYFTAGVIGGTRLSLTPTVAGDEIGTSILAQTVSRGLDVCVAPIGTWGDVNGDQVVNIIDAQQIARFAVGLPVLAPIALITYGDVTGDNAVNIIDAQQIARFGVGLLAAARVSTVDVIPPGVASLSIAPSALTVSANATLQLSATPRDGSNADLTGCAPITWTSSDPSKATVNANGLVSGVAPGSTTITATAGMQSAQVVVSVNASPLAPVVTIIAINQTSCAVTCVSVPANLAAVSGQMDVQLSVDGRGQSLSSTQATLTCGASTMTQTQQTNAASVLLSFPTGAFNATTGVPTLANGPCTLAASSTSSGGTSALANATLTLANTDGLTIVSTFAPSTNAEGLAQATSANDAAGMVWHAGDVTITAIPVLYSGRTVATMFISLPGATSPTQTLSSPPFAATWSATATTGPRVTGLTLADTTGCNSPARPPTCGAYESNGITPLGVMPQVTALDNLNNGLGLVVLNPVTARFRLDNSPPQAPLAFNPPGRQFAWVNGTYAFTGIGGGAATANVGTTTGTENFISCGDGPNTIPGNGAPATQNPYVCQPQIGVSATSNGNAIAAAGSASTNGRTTLSFYAIPTAFYVDASTANGTATTAAACSTIGWTKITNAGDLAPTLSNTAYVVRVFESDALLNARCTDLTNAPSLAQLGTFINTGVATQHLNNRGSLGVDKFSPFAVFNEPPSFGSAGANMAIGIGGVTPNFSLAMSDNASGFSAAPVFTTVTRLAMDPVTHLPSTVASSFGCPIGVVVGGLCSSVDRATLVAADAGSGADASGCVGCGYFTYTGQAHDLARNTATTLTRSVVIDRQAPTINNLNVPATILGGQSVFFHATAVDNLDLASSDFTLTYAANPSGNPAANFASRSPGLQLGVAFDNVLTVAASFDTTVPFSMRSMATVTASGAPQHNAGLPTQVTVRVYDAAGNTSAPFNAAIPGGNVPQTNPTNYTTPQQNGASLLAFLAGNPASSISNCPFSGCVGGSPPANLTSLALVAIATASEGPGSPFTNPFSFVQFYFFDTTSNEWTFVDAAVAPVVADNPGQTVRTLTWTSQIFDPPSALGSGTTLKLLAVGVNASGDALASAVNTNVNLTNP